MTTTGTLAGPGILEAKKEAAKSMKPLLMAQAIQEVDTYHTLVNNLISAGLLGGDDDPRHSDEIAKSGKMKMLKSTMDENVWQKFYFVMVRRVLHHVAASRCCITLLHHTASRRRRRHLRGVPASLGGGPKS